MKKLLKTGLLSAALLATVVVNAADKVTVKVSEAKTLNVSLTEVTKNEEFSILDRNGKTLFSERLKGALEYNKTFDFSNLPEGIYFLEAKEANKIVVTPVMVTISDVSIIKGISKVYKKPTISLENKVAKVLLKNESKVAVHITIYSGTGELLFETEENDNKLVIGAFDFSKLPTDTYRIVVSEDEYTFSEDIKI